RRGDDDLLRTRVAVALAGLGAYALTEGLELLRRAAVSDDAPDRRHGGPDTRHLALGLPAAANHAERPRAAPREVLRCDAACRSGAQLAEPVGLDDGSELGPLRVEDAHDERRSAGQRCVGLEACEVESAVDCAHEREDSA